MTKIKRYNNVSSIIVYQITKIYVTLQDIRITIQYEYRKNSNRFRNRKD